MKGGGKDGKVTKKVERTRTKTKGRKKRIPEKAEQGALCTVLGVLIQEQQKEKKGTTNDRVQARCPCEVGKQTTP